MAGGNSQKGNAGISKCRIEDIVINAALKSLVRTVIKLDGGDDAERSRIAQYKIDVFGGDPIECRLPCAAAFTSDCMNDVCKSDFHEDFKFGSDGLFQDSEK